MSRIILPCCQKKTKKKRYLELVLFNFNRSVDNLRAMNTRIMVLNLPPSTQVKVYWVNKTVEPELRLNPSLVNTNKFIQELDTNLDQWRPNSKIWKPRLSCKWCSLNAYHLHQLSVNTRETSTKFPPKAFFNIHLLYSEILASLNFNKN